MIPRGRARNVALVLLLAVAAAAPAAAFQTLLNKAKKFGAKDCLFCHTHDDGGEGWNERGQWLMDEKARRGAEKVDVEWLADYKPRDADKPTDDKQEKPKP
jgi:mono/diheme cytochrome c family protein